VDQETLQRCQDLIGYRFGDISLLNLALTHSSVAPTRVESNERMEFLGDAVLGLVVCHDLYEKDEGLTEGEMTKVKSTVVSRQTCAEIIQQMGIDDLVFMGKGLATPGGVPASIAAAVFESLIGAIYLDGGLEPARKFILDNVRPYIDEALANEHQRNFKSMLQQVSQRKFNATPDYLLLDEKGPDHSKCFEIAVCINGKHFRSAWGKSKKEAEQDAARFALEELGLLIEEELGDEA
jgi:ribonuclease-3